MNQIAATPSFPADLLALGIRAPVVAEPLTRHIRRKLGDDAVVVDAHPSPDRDGHRPRRRHRGWPGGRSRRWRWTPAGIALLKIEGEQAVALSAGTLDKPRWTWRERPAAMSARRTSAEHLAALRLARLEPYHVSCCPAPLPHPLLERKVMPSESSSSDNPSSFTPDEGTAVIARSFCPSLNAVSLEPDPQEQLTTTHALEVNARINAFVMGVAMGGLPIDACRQLTTFIQDLLREVNRLSETLPPEMTAPAKARLNDIARIAHLTGESPK